jgi:uncharacterized protein (TIGR02147 family)
MKPMIEYEDYRSWLRSWVAERPHQRSQRALARKLEVASSYVNMVFSGKRKLAVDEADAWAEVLKLSPDEREHWIAMVRSAHGNEVERQGAKAELSVRREVAKAWRMPVETDAFASWHTYAILELSRCRGFRCDPEWIATALNPPITVEDAARSLEALLEVGFVERSADGGARASSGSVFVPALPEQQQVERFKQLHRDQLAYAATVLDHPASERHVIGMVFAVPHEALPELKEAVTKAVRIAVQNASASGEPTQVFQLSVQLVPRSRSPS